MAGNSVKSFRRIEFCAAVIAALAALLIAPGPASAGGTQWRLKVNGMVCSFCAQGIKRKLSEIPGVRSIAVDIQAHTISLITGDAFKGGETSIRKAVQEAGYAMTSIQQSSPSP